MFISLKYHSISGLLGDIFCFPVDWLTKKKSLYFPFSMQVLTGYVEVILSFFR